jgi:hypothetical protein
MDSRMHEEVANYPGKPTPGNWWYFIPVLLFPFWVNAATPPILFGPPVHYSLGTNVDGICSGDFNGDSRLDLATFSRFSGGRVTIWTNSGSAVFVVRTNYIMAETPQVMATGYVNNDAHLDLVTVNYPGDSISSFLGNGDGTFNRVDMGISINYNFPGLALADFDGDGKLDIALNTYGVKILRGNGNGTFTTFTNYSANSGYEIVAHHLNSDTNLDLVTGNYSSSSMSVYAGNGNGTFATPTNYSGDSSEYHYSVVAADFNHDSKLDLVTVNQYHGSASVRLNNGDGTFGAETKYKTALSAWSLQVADFNGDDHPDILTGQGFASASLAILPGKGDGTFGTALTNFPGVSGGLTKQAIAARDFDGDGRPDIVTVRGTNNAVTVRLNQSPTPTLHVTGVADGVRLNWPNWSGYLLEGNTNLQNKNSWVLITNSPAIVGAEKVLTNSIPEENQFYRLRRPLP